MKKIDNYTYTMESKAKTTLGNFLNIFCIDSTKKGFVHSKTEMFKSIPQTKVNFKMCRDHAPMVAFVILA